MSRARQCETHGYPIMVNGDRCVRTDSTVWHSPEPKPEAHVIQGRVAFWKGVKIEE